MTAMPDLTTIPAPAGATGVTEWMDWDDGIWIRSFDHLDYEGIVKITGTQLSDGAIAYTVGLARIEELDGAGARRLAVLLEAAAAEVDRLGRCLG